MIVFLALLLLTLMAVVTDSPTLAEADIVASISVLLAWVTGRIIKEINNELRNET